ncbi:MAG TPA: metalloregulator ArsR/SmtB family transcription factor [Ktedonobacterales bacterium]|nr:metalloregulator ArsR/SmtB family transcription factor [Ktedonobacterales bacterium]
MSPHPLSPTLQVDACPAYEFVLSLAVWSDQDEHATYEVEAGWFDVIRAQASPDLLKDIEEFSHHCDMIWAHLISLAYECPAPRDVPTFLAYLKTCDPMEVRLRLLGYYVRYCRRATPPEVMAAAAAGDREAQRRFLQTSYPDDAAWQAALMALFPLTPAETSSRLISMLERWYTEVFRAEEPRLLPILERDAEATRLLAVSLSLEHLIETICNGWEYIPEPGIRHILFIPSVVVRPVIDTFDHHEVKIICYPVADENMTPEGDMPSPRMLRLFKALSDELRLRILKRLSTGQYTLQQLANHFNVSKTLMHHHLIALRGAGLVQVRERPQKVYSLRRDTVAAVGPLLTKYLEEPPG